MDNSPASLTRRSIQVGPYPQRRTLACRIGLRLSLAQWRRQGRGDSHRGKRHRRRHGSTASGSGGPSRKRSTACASMSQPDSISSMNAEDAGPPACLPRRGPPACASLRPGSSPRHPGTALEGVEQAGNGMRGRAAGRIMRQARSWLVISRVRSTASSRKIGNNCSSSSSSVAAGLLPGPPVPLARPPDSAWAYCSAHRATE